MGGNDMNRANVLLFVLIVLSTPTILLASRTSDQQALAFAAQAMAALTGGNTITDVTLTGNATRTVGSDQGSGPATLYAKGTAESRLDLSLSNGKRSEIRNSSSGALGEWIDSNGSPHLFAPANCLTDAAWFFPTLSSLALANSQNQTLSYIGLETLNGASVQHLRSVWSGDSLTTMDFYLDAISFLPVATNFNTHPDIVTAASGTSTLVSQASLPLL